MNQVPELTLNNGVSIPQLGFGVWQVSSDDIVASVGKALEVGYRHIDTAAAYGNEDGVGMAIAESGIDRSELFVTTKLWSADHGNAAEAFDKSLDNLGLDYVDLYLIHWPAPGRELYIDAWKELEKIYADGRAKSIGVSNFMPHHLRRLLAATTVVPAVNQIEVHPTNAQNEVQAVNAEHEVLTEAYSPLGLAQDLTAPDVVTIAERLGRTPAQVILRWHIQAGRIVFPKSVTPARIAENFDIFDFELDAADMGAINALDTGNRLGGDPDTFNG